MNSLKKPLIKPNCPLFSCGPTRKIPNWQAKNLNPKLIGRSHRAPYVVKHLQNIISLQKKLLNIPDNYKVIITPGSATGAIELGLWHMVGKLNVNAFVFDHFSLDRALLLHNEFQIKDLQIYFLNNFINNDILNKFKSNANFNLLVEGSIKTSNKTFDKTVNIKAVSNAFSVVDFNKQDSVLTLCGTSMAVDFKNLNNIKEDRKGLIFADATSYAFCQEIPWQKLDVTAWSFQKALGSEPGLGVLVLSPRAIKRVNNFKPSFACPKIYDLRNEDGKINNNLLDSGVAINTYSGLCIADCSLALEYFNQHGAEYFYNKVKENNNTFNDFVNQSQYYDFMIKDSNYRSLNVAYLKVKHKLYNKLNSKQQEFFINNICNLLESEGIAYDIKAYRQSPIGIRFWLGPLIESYDIKALCEYLEYTCAKTLQTNQ